MGPPKMPSEAGFLGSGESQPPCATFAISKTSRHVVLAKPRVAPQAFLMKSQNIVLLMNNEAARIWRANEAFACGKHEKNRFRGFFNHHKLNKIGFLIKLADITTF